MFFIFKDETSYLRADSKQSRRSTSSRKSSKMDEPKSPLPVVSKPISQIKEKNDDEASSLFGSSDSDEDNNSSSLFGERLEKDKSKNHFLFFLTFCFFFIWCKLTN